MAQSVLFPKLVLAALAALVFAALWALIPIVQGGFVPPPNIPQTPLATQGDGKDLPDNDVDGLDLPEMRVYDSVWREWVRNDLIPNNGGWSQFTSGQLAQIEEFTSGSGATPQMIQNFFTYEVPIQGGRQAIYQSFINLPTSPFAILNNPMILMGVP